MALLANEKRWQEKGDSSSEVLVAWERSERRQQGRLGKSCSKSRPRDVTPDDYLKYKKKRNWKKNKSVEAVNTVTSCGEDFESMLVMTPSIRCASEWILDIRCSYICARIKDFFIPLRR